MKLKIQMKGNIRFILVVFILAITNVFLYMHIFRNSSVTAQTNNEFPNQISNWIAKEVIYDKIVLDSLSPDRIIYKSYYRNGDPPITLFIAYYNTLEKADLSHSPIVCFTGQGWEIVRTIKSKIPINQLDSSYIKVNQIILKKRDTTMNALFWYQSVNRAFANKGLQKIDLFFRRLLGKTDNNAFVRVTATVPNTMSQEETTHYLFSFVRDSYPELRRFFL